MGLINYVLEFSVLCGFLSGYFFRAQFLFKRHENVFMSLYMVALVLIKEPVVILWGLSLVALIFLGEVSHSIKMVAYMVYFVILIFLLYKLIESGAKNAFLFLLIVNFFAVIFLIFSMKSKLYINFSIASVALLFVWNKMPLLMIFEKR